eukprot:g20052.t1
MKLVNVYDPIGNQKTEWKRVLQPEMMDSTAIIAAGGGALLGALGFFLGSKLGSGGKGDKSSAKKGLRGPINVYYHNGFSGRAEPIRMILEDAEVEYKMVRSFNQLPQKDWPSFACPAIQVGTFTMAQTPAICQYLGQALGYDLASVDARARVAQASLDVADIWSESYKARSNKDKGKEFVEAGRLAKWLKHISAIVDASEGPYLFGKQATYADFQFLNLMNTLDFMFGKEAVAKVTPAQLQACRVALERRPQVAKFMADPVKFEPVLYPAVRAGA